MKRIVLTVTVLVVFLTSGGLSPAEKKKCQKDYQGPIAEQPNLTPGRTIG